MVHHRSIPLRILSFLLLVTFAFAGVITAKEPKGSRTRGLLDGKAFVGETGRDGKDRGRSAKFVFSKGKFRASAFSAYGFSDAKYETTEVDGELRFSAAVVSSRESGGSMHWTGTVRGDVVEGTMRWDHGWESKQYWFRGRIKGPRTARR